MLFLSVSFLFFQRLDCSGESVPQFQRRQQWYELFVLLGKVKNSKKAMLYETLLQWTKKAYEAASNPGRRRFVPPELDELSRLSDLG